MRGAFLAAVVVGLLFGGTVAGARLMSGDNGSPAPASTPAETPTPDPGSPLATAESFASAFASRDTEAIFGMLDASSLRIYTLPDLQSVYSNFYDETTFRSLTAEVTQHSETGAAFLVTLSTAYFGDIEYSIQVPFTADSDRYAITWSPAAVHPELRAGLRMTSTIERPSRGSILDRDGAPLAQTINIRYIGLNRAIIPDRAAVTARLEAFGFPRADIDAAFDSPLGLSQRVDVGTVEDARAEEANRMVVETTGLVIYFVSQRQHPLGPAAAHAVGYTRELTADELRARSGQGYRTGDRVGATGLEATMDSILAGRAGGVLNVVNGAGAVSATIVERPFVQGQDVQTTLRSSVLVATQQRLGERLGAAIVMDPRDNSILALNSSPSFDPNAFERGDSAAISAIFAKPGDPLNNRATAGLYSAGSTFKLVTGAAGLLSGQYSPSSVLDCGALWYGVDPPRRNWEGARGPLTIAQGLMRSCNPVFYEIGLTLYQTDNFLSEVARSFGFGEPTGTVGINDEAGLVPDAAWKRANRGDAWFPGDEVNLSIGQGDLLITPLQLVNSYSAFITNTLRTPIILAGQEAVERGPLGLSPAIHEHLTNGLKLVTGPSGTANYAFSNAGYTYFAGKSGTAEDTNEQQHVLFVAYAPADAPAAVAAVVLEDGESGSIEAGPMARDMVLAALQ